MDGFITVDHEDVRIARTTGLQVFENAVVDQAPVQEAVGGFTIVGHEVVTIAKTMDLRVIANVVVGQAPVQAVVVQLRRRGIGTAAVAVAAKV